MTNVARDEVLRILAQHRETLKSFGVRELSLFGSVARNEAKSDSDVDLLVDFDRPTGYFGLVRLQLYLEELLGCRVDLGLARSLKPRVRERVLREAIHVP